MNITSCYDCGIVVNLDAARILKGHEDAEGVYHDCCWPDYEACHTWTCPICDTVNDTDKPVD